MERRNSEFIAHLPTVINRQVTSAKPCGRGKGRVLESGVSSSCAELRSLNGEAESQDLHRMREVQENNI